MCGKQRSMAGAAGERVLAGKRAVRAYMARSKLASVLFLLVQSHLVPTEVPPCMSPT